MFLYIYISLYLHSFLFINLYLFPTNVFYEFNVFFDFWINQTMLKLTYCNLHHHLVLLTLYFHDISIIFPPISHCILNPYSRTFVATVCAVPHVPAAPRSSGERGAPAPCTHSRSRTAQRSERWRALTL